MRSETPRTLSARTICAGMCASAGLPTVRQGYNSAELHCYSENAGNCQVMSCWLPVRPAHVISETRVATEHSVPVA